MVIKIERMLQASLLHMGTLLLKRLILLSLDHLLLALLLRFHTEPAEEFHGPDLYSISFP
jgi:hypothetical protein